MVSAPEIQNEESSMRPSTYRSEEGLYHSRNRNAQSGKDSFSFGRLKCRSAALSDDNNYDHHDYPGRSSDTNKSIEVHKINTPWLAAAEDSSRKKNRIKDMSSVQENRFKTDNTTTQKEANNHLRSVLGLQKQKASAERTIDRLLSKPNLTSQPPHHVFHGIASNDFASSTMKSVAEGGIDKTDRNDKETVGSRESVADDDTDAKEYGKHIDCDKSILSDSSESESSLFDDLDEAYPAAHIRKDKPSPIVSPQPLVVDNGTRSNFVGTRTSVPPQDSPQAKHIERYVEHQKPGFPSEGIKRHGLQIMQSKITTPRRRNTSPSPSKLRGRQQSKMPTVPQKERYEPQRNESPDYDRELLMGLSMQRDLDRMSLKCGATGSAHPGTEKQSLRQGNKGFSILPSMSCFNPSSQLDVFETGNNFHGINVHDQSNQVWVERSKSKPARSMPAGNGVCSAASSALLCDINDDDELWKYYDGMKPMNRSSIPKRQNAEYDPPESREFENSFVEQRQEKYSMERERRASYEGDRFGEFGPPISNSDMPRYRETGYPNEGPGSFSNSRTTSNLEPESDYESLMNYPTQLRHDDGEPQQTREEMLNQMRQAVKKASAQLNSLKKLNSSSDQYRMTMTMETECSDESSYVTSLHKQHRVQPFPPQSDKRISNEYLNDNYGTEPGTQRATRYGYI